MQESGGFQRMGNLMGAELKVAIVDVPPFAIVRGQGGEGKTVKFCFFKVYYGRFNIALAY